MFYLKEQEEKKAEKSFLRVSFLLSCPFSTINLFFVMDESFAWFPFAFFNMFERKKKVSDEKLCESVNNKGNRNNFLFLPFMHNDLPNVISHTIKKKSNRKKWQQNKQLTRTCCLVYFFITEFRIRTNFSAFFSIVFNSSRWSE